jgi:Fe2+ transport system protein B
MEGLALEKLLELGATLVLAVFVLWGIFQIIRQVGLPLVKEVGVMAAAVNKLAESNGENRNLLMQVHTSLGDIHRTLRNLEGVLERSGLQVRQDNKESA